MRTTGTRARGWWWLESGLSGYLGFHPGVNRSTLLFGAGTLAVLGLIAFIFRGAGIAAGRPHGSVANVAGLLVVCQFVCLAAARAGTRGGVFRDPPGPLLPYSAAHRLVLWSLIVVGPIAVGLGSAYAGVRWGTPRITWSAVAAAWLVDGAALAAFALALDLIRWSFRTYAPLGAQRLWALIVVAVFNVVVGGFALLCLIVALQFGVRRVFVSHGVTEALRMAASLAIGSDVQSRFVGFDNLSAMSVLVTQGKDPSAVAGTACVLALATVLLLTAALPGARPEELDRIARYASLTRQWAMDVAIRVWPRSLRVAGRLMMTPLYLAAGSAAFGALTLMMTAFMLTWAGLSPAHDPRAVERVLEANAAVLAALLAVLQLPIAAGIPLDQPEYVRHAMLPLPIPSLLRRMTIVGVGGAAVISGVLAMTWALIVQPDRHVAVAFTASVVLVQTAVLPGYVALRALAWRSSRPLGPVTSRAWVVLPAVYFIWQFGLLRHSPGVLDLIAVFALPAGIVALSGAWLGITRMVAAREPTAGM